MNYLNLFNKHRQYMTAEHERYCLLKGINGFSIIELTGTISNMNGNRLWRWAHNEN